MFLEVLEGSVLGDTTASGVLDASETPRGSDSDSGGPRYWSVLSRTLSGCFSMSSVLLGLLLVLPPAGVELRCTRSVSPSSLACVSSNCSNRLVRSVASIPESRTRS